MVRVRGLGLRVEALVGEVLVALQLNDDLYVCVLAVHDPHSGGAADHEAHLEHGGCRLGEVRRRLV